jgi:hypothetical protein
MSIAICIPSRGRPEFLERLVTTAKTSATDPNDIIIKYYLNDDDQQLENYKKILDGLVKKFGNSVQYEIGPDRNTVYTWNVIAESLNADYSMLAGDEIQFVTKGWDEKIKNIKKEFPDGIFCVATYDGRKYTKEHRPCTQPIVTKEWYNALGYYWSPMFWHWNVDQYTGDLARSIRRYIYREDILIKMKKLKDKTGMRNRKTGVFQRDHYVFEKMKKIYFEHDKQKLLGACK